MKYTYGNTSANIMNSGTALECPAGIVYIGPDFCVYKETAESGGPFLNVKARYLNYWDGYLYFTDEGGRICRVPADRPEEPEILVPFDCMCVNIMNGTLYFRNLSDGKKLYAADPDGRNIRKVCDAAALFLNAYRGKLYFCDADSYNLFCVDCSGSNLKMLSGHKIYYPNMAGDRIVYSDKTQGGHLYSMELDGGGIEPIDETAEAYYLNVFNGKIYYRNYRDGHTLWVCDWKSRRSSKLLDEDIFQINSVPGSLFFCKKIEGGRICRLKIDT